MTLAERLAARDSAVELDAAAEPAAVLERRIDELGQISLRFTVPRGRPRWR